MIHITDANTVVTQDTAITIGKFDGLHRGHTKLIEKVKGYEDLLSVVFSFSPHPRSVLTNEEVLQICSQEERKEMIEKAGIDVFVEYRFDLEFAKLTPKTFLRDILVKKFNCKVLVLGETYRFGRNAVGDVDYILDMTKELGIELVVVPNELVCSEKISSSAIRRLIKAGNINEANKLLGHTYSARGPVEKGNGIGGAILGYPTANMAVCDKKVLPNNGVYATKTYYKGVEYQSLTYIGTKPTINHNSTVVETYLMDFSEDLYMKEIEVHFYDKVRGEKKFDTLEDLREGIKADVELIKKGFAAKN